MMVQIAQRRPYRQFKVYEVQSDGAIVNRPRTLVVRLPKHCCDVAELGTVWKVDGILGRNDFTNKDGFKIEQDLLKAGTAEYLRPSGELLARWIYQNIDGIGEVKARRLVRAFDDLDAVVRAEDLAALSQVAGMSETTAQRVIDGWLSPIYYQAIRWLQNAKLPLRLADRLSRVYKDEVIHKLKQDPFILTAFGIAFKDVQRVIRKLKLSVSEERWLAAIADRVTTAYCLESRSTQISAEQLLEQAQPLCEKLKKPLDKLVESALGQGVLVETPTGYQALGTAIQEASVARFLMACHTRNPGSGSILAGWERDLDDATITTAIAQYEAKLGFDLTEEQRAAIALAVSHPVASISGGAGTGKTTILRGVLDVYEQVSEGVALYQLALSGRAARRMSESTGRPAVTIAKFIAEYFNKTTGKPEPNKLPDHLLLVVDEASMVDLLSAYKLTGLLPYATRVLTVGDVAQLPPVGAGLVFHAMMQSALPRVELTAVKRQSDDSGIHALALSVRAGQYDPELLKPSNGDVRYSACTDAAHILQTHTDNGGADQCIVLTPLRRGPLGVQAINSLIQSQHDAQNPPVLHHQHPLLGWIEWVTSSQTKLRLSDQVIVTANDYDNDIRNGDLGTITAVWSEAESGAVGMVRIDGVDIPITMEVLEKLDLGYAITIHKSQGSQWPTCLLLLPDYAQSMIDQTLMYTAITRASEALIVIGDSSLIETSVKRGSLALSRETNLAARLAHYSSEMN